MKTDLRQKPTLGQRPHGFTLIELLVVISIIAIITSIGVVVGGSALRSAAESQTQVVLGQLMGAATEYKEQVGQHVTFVIDGATYDSAVPDADADARSINLFVSNVRLNSKPAFEQLRTIDDDSILSLENSFESGVFSNSTAGSEHNSVLDPFDKFIRYYPGSNNLSTAASDANLIDKGMPKRKQPYFASAGQDGLWGRIDEVTNEPDDDASDNLYSFEVK